MDPETRRKRYVKLLDAFILFNHGALLGDPEPKVVQPLINATAWPASSPASCRQPTNRPGNSVRRWRPVKEVAVGTLRGREKNSTEFIGWYQRAR